MQLLLVAVWEFITRMLMPSGPNFQAAFAKRPAWQRVLLVVLMVIIAATLAVALTFLLFGVGAFVLGAINGWGK